MITAEGIELRAGSRILLENATFRVAPGDRVGTFQWNNNEHMTAYVAIPAMGSVLHTINIRLFPDQITYIANHAADRLTTPLIRRGGRLREASWDEAMGLIVEQVQETCERYTSGALGLYEKVGMKVTQTWVALALDLAPEA